MRCAWLVIAVVACGPRAPRPTPQPPEPPPAERYTTGSRAATSEVERTLAARTILLDPALDCVARAVAMKAPAAPNPAQYRNALPVRCGSPFYVVRARLVADDAALLAAVDAFEREVPSTAQLVLGIAMVGSQRAVVMARRLVELEPVSRSSAPVIAGHLLRGPTAGRMLISTAAGLVTKPFEIHEGRFSVETGAPRDATIELAFLAGQTSEPFARIEIGAGSSLFRRDGSLMTRIGEARTAIGAAPLQRRDAVGTCDRIPPQIDGIDVTDRARCFDLPLLDLDDVADEIAYRPLLQDVLLTPAASLIEIGASHQGTPAIQVRVLMRFETLTPEAARARVLDKLHQRWPQLAERRADGLATIIDTWTHDPDVFGSTAKYKPALDRIAGKWTTTQTYYDALTTARDLDAALALVQPEDTPTAVDAAVAQVRGKDGAMLHAIAIVLELP